MSYYAIRQGENGEILTKWADVQKLMSEWNAKRRVNRLLPKVEHKKFPTEEEAKQFLEVGYTPNYEKRAKRADFTHKAERIAEFTNALETATAAEHAIFYVDGASNSRRSQIGVHSTVDSSGVTQNFTILPLTSNRCEIAASICAMQLFLQRRELPEYKPFKGLTIFTDNSYSKIAQDQAHKRWYDSGVWVTSEGKTVENVDLLICSVQLRREIQRLGLELDIQLVPGHRNIAADTLSKAEGVFENFKLLSRTLD